MDAVPLIIFWCLAVWGFFSRKPVLLYLFFTTMPFAAFAVIPPQLTGGLTFTPTPIVAVLIIVRTLANPSGVDFTIGSVLSPRRTFMLFMFWLIAVFTTAFMPRLFAGRVDVIPMRGSELGAQPLFPSTQNISQLAYLTISVFAVVAFSRLLSNHGMRHAVKALFLGALVTVFTGALDFASDYLPLEPLLEPFRKATYAMITSAEVLGVQRVVGLTPEASTFGGLCIAFLSAVYFFRFSLPPTSLYYRSAPILMGLLVLFLWMSTSSAAYVAFGAFLLIAALEWLWSGTMVRDGLRRRRLAAEFWVAYAGFVALTIVTLVHPSLLNPIIDTVDTMVFQKPSSESFQERSIWTAVSWKAAWETYGLGVGMGGTRASSSLVAVISNVGFLGALFYYLFILQTLLVKVPAADRSGQSMIGAMRWCIWPGFITSLLAGSTADFGLFNAFLFSVPYAVSSSIYSQHVPLPATLGARR